MSDLDADIKSVELQVQAGAQAVSDRIQRQQADDRSLIAKVIIFAFIALVVISVLAAIAGAYLFDWQDLVEPGKFLMTILGSVMLPVVTLVIGYYFGSK
jgi:ABC-type glycerol-3-phosphate transport system permease component